MAVLLNPPGDFHLGCGVRGGLVDVVDYISGFIVVGKVVRGKCLYHRLARRVGVIVYIVWGFLGVLAHPRADETTDACNSKSRRCSEFGDFDEEALFPSSAKIADVRGYRCAAMSSSCL